MWRHKKGCPGCGAHQAHSQCSGVAESPTQDVDQGRLGRIIFQIPVSRLASCAHSFAGSPATVTSYEDHPARRADSRSDRPVHCPTMNCRENNIIAVAGQLPCDSLDGAVLSAPGSGSRSTLAAIPFGQYAGRRSAAFAATTAGRCSVARSGRAIDHDGPPIRLTRQPAATQACVLRRPEQ